MGRGASRQEWCLGIAHGCFAACRCLMQQVKRSVAWRIPQGSRRGEGREGPLALEDAARTSRAAEPRAAAEEPLEACCTTPGDVGV
jgi:hypothetical protein